LRELPGVRTSESPIDHALTLLLAGEIDAALRWAAAVLERSPSPAALILTSRLLDQMGRSRAAAEGFQLAVEQAVDAGELPLAIAAIDDLRAGGHDVRPLLDAVASAFCRGSARLRHTELSSPGPAHAGVAEFVQPLSPFLAGPALASKATQILQAVKRACDDGRGADSPPVPALPLFSALSRETLCDLLGVFQTITVPAGSRVIEEGSEGIAAYVVARGEVETSRRATRGDNEFTLALSRLGGGAFFGEMALLSALPSPSSVTTTRPTILLVARRDALVLLAAKRPEISSQLAAHCRRNSLANLGWTSPIVAAVSPEDRASLVEGLEICIFDKGDRLIHDGEDVTGLHLVVSGEVAIVAREWDERVLLATLGAGETLGEMELVLCRKAFADAVALRPTATLFLSRDEYSLLVQDHPSILHGLYSIAVQRHTETSFALQSGSAVVADDWLLEATANESPPAAPRMHGSAIPVVHAPPLPREGVRKVPMPLDPPTELLASVPPTAATVRPASRPPRDGRTSGIWFALGGVAGGAAVAAVLAVLAGRAPGVARSAAGGSASAAPTVVAIVPAPSAPVQPVPAPLEPAPVAPTSAPARPTAAVRASAPKPLVARPQPSAVAGSPAVNAPPALAVVALKPARSATAPAGPSSEASVAVTSAGDEFGGRQ
jgi:CRP-like cAMP-binding protein